jgi:hypothetical protein
MTIKQQGGIFGRNPTFNDLTVEGTLTTSGTQTVDALNVTNNLDVDGVITTDGLTVNATTTTLEGSADQILQLRTTNSSADNRIYFGRTGEDTRGIIYFQHNGGKLRYDVDSNKIFEVTNASGLAMQRNVSFTAGNGIDFSATSGTGTSELFDDYEEGTYTPALEGMTGGAVTYTSQFGRYTKIGRQVNVFFFMHVNTNTNTGGNTGVSVPFVPDVGGSNYIYVGPIGRNSTSNSFITHVSFFSGIATALFYTPAAATLNGSAVTNGSVLSGSITYFV